MSEINFGTITVERETDTNAECLFAAFAEASQREKWGASSGPAAFIVEQDEFEEMIDNTERGHPLFGSVDLMTPIDEQEPAMRDYPS